MRSLFVSLRMYLIGYPSSFLSLCVVYREVSTRVTRKKKKTEKKKKGKTLCDAIHLSNSEEKKEERFFLLLDKKPGQRKRVVREWEKKRNGKARALITSLNGSLARSRCHCRRSWVPTAHKTRMRIRIKRR